MSRPLAHERCLVGHWRRPAARRQCRPPLPPPVQRPRPIFFTDVTPAHPPSWASSSHSRRLPAPPQRLPPAGPPPARPPACLPAAPATPTVRGAARRATAAAVATLTAPPKFSVQSSGKEGAPPHLRGTLQFATRQKTNGRRSRRLQEVRHKRAAPPLHPHRPTRPCLSPRAMFITPPKHRAGHHCKAPNKA